jgi:hypothetical protein
VSQPFFKEEEEEIKANKAKPRNLIFEDERPVFGRRKLSTTVEEVSGLRFIKGDKVNWEIVAAELGTSEFLLRKWRTENYCVSALRLPCLCP